MPTSIAPSVEGSGVSYNSELPNEFFGLSRELQLGSIEAVIVSVERVYSSIERFCEKFGTHSLSFESWHRQGQVITVPIAATLKDNDGTMTIEVNVDVQCITRVLDLRGTRHLLNGLAGFFEGVGVTLLKRERVYAGVSSGPLNVKTETLH